MIRLLARLFEIQSIENKRLFQKRLKIWDGIRKYESSFDTGPYLRVGVCQACCNLQAPSSELVRDHVCEWNDFDTCLELQSRWSVAG